MFFNHDSSSKIRNISIPEFKVKFLKLHFLANNINDNIFYFNLKIAYISKAAFSIVSYILIIVTWEIVFKAGKVEKY